MSFKLAVLFASMAIISCATFDSREQTENFDNHGRLQQQNDQRHFSEKTRFEDRRFHHQDRDDDYRYHHEHNLNNREFFAHSNNPQNPMFLHLHPAVFNIQSSSRHFDIKDDSNYDISYSVSDMTTGDIKTHQETRRGDEVNGQYTIVDSDGFQRKVNYRANDRDGFDAEVKREPVVGLGFSNNYQGHHNQHNFGNSQQFQNKHFGNEFNQNNQQAQLLTHPKSVATTSVSKTEDGQLNQYITTTTTN